MDTEKNSKMYENTFTPPWGLRVSTKFLVFLISPRVAIVSAIRN